MDAQAFLLQLESNTLPAAEFNHRAHLLAAWSYRRLYPAREAAARCARALSRYAMAQGAAEKYHHTLTMASLTLVYDRLDAMPECLDNWPDFVAANPDLVDGLPALLRQHYSEHKLNDDIARRAFVEPDLAPLPMACLLH